MYLKKWVKKLMVLVILAFILLTSLPSTTSTNIDDIEVDVETQEELSVILEKNDKLLYKIDYLELFIDTEFEDHSVPFNDGDWDVEIVKETDGKFPHVTIDLEKEIHDNGEVLGLIHLAINVISYQDISEVTFSFSLREMNNLPGGTLSIIQDVETNGQMARIPGQTKPGTDPIEFYKFTFNDGHVGYYSWNKEIKFDGVTSQADSLTLQDGKRLIIRTDYVSDIEEVSLTPLEMDKTKISSSVPVPEPLDNLPSFVIGLMLGGGIIIGVLVEKRREFYKNRKTENVVKLEESYYYRGKE